MKAFNKNVIAEFRANKGVVEQFGEGTLLILTTTGARTRQLRENPLVYNADNDRYIIFASYAGNEHHPPWYHNLVADPEVCVEVDEERFRARAEVVAEPERSRLYAAMAEKIPMFTEYQNNTKRIIPVIALTRIEK